MEKGGDREDRAQNAICLAKESACLAKAIAICLATQSACQRGIRMGLHADTDAAHRDSISAQLTPGYFDLRCVE